MKYKHFAAILAATLVLAYLAAPVVKLNEVALAVVVLVGAVMLLVDLWQSLHSKGD
jgi:hypothetical protein